MKWEPPLSSLQYTSLQNGGLKAMLLRPPLILASSFFMGLRVWVLLSVSPISHICFTGGFLFLCLVSSF